MDWFQILINCIIWVIGVVVFFAGLYAVIIIPMALMMLAVGAVWHVFRLFFRFCLISGRRWPNRQNRAKKVLIGARKPKRTSTASWWNTYASST